MRGRSESFWFRAGLASSASVIGVLLALFLVPDVFSSGQANAYFESGKPLPGQKPSMNDIVFEDYKDFPTTWHLVTVRYRLDSNEMRLTYANDIAWKAMRDLKPDYPEGAAFGKIGIITEKDPAFPSSIVPSGAKRYQLMIKNKKKYKDTDGWGYALFDASGHLFEDYTADIKAKTMACAACHRIVPERDYVFSRPMLIQYGAEMLPELVPGKTAAYRFKKTSAEKFPQTVQAEAKAKTLQSLEGDLQKHAFSGTLDEVIPLLIEQSQRTKDSSILFVNEKNFTLVSKQKSCGGGKFNYRFVIYANGKKVRDAEACQ